MAGVKQPGITCPSPLLFRTIDALKTVHLYSRFSNAMQSSELILNPDGSIYHLALLPEQVAPTILLVGDQERVPKVSRYFDQMEHQVKKREFVTHTGRIGDLRLSVVSTGIGPDNIDIVINELDALFNIDLENRTPKDNIQSLSFIRLGTAGCLRPEVPVDGLVASSGGLGMDGLLQFYLAPKLQNHPLLAELRAHMGEDWAFPVSPYFTSGDAGWLDVFQKDFYQGITMTNPGFYGPQGRQLRAPVRQPRYLDLLQQFDYQGQKIVNLEMETAAIYGLANLLGHRAVSLSVILANRALGQFSADSGKAIRRLIETALGRLNA